MSADIDFPLYSDAITIPIFSLLAILLCIPPLVWHTQHRNIGAASLIFWLTIANTMSFLNALIWPRDNILDWWQGYGLCDIEIRLMTMIPTAQMGAVVVILHDLATVLNTNKIIVSTSAVRKRRKLFYDLMICFFLPSLTIIFFYFVQVYRYVILTIQGCFPTLSPTWMTILLIAIWPPILQLIGCYFAVLVLVRMYLYRREFSILLSTSDTTRSRFIRLLLVATLTILSSLPLTMLQLARSIATIPEDSDAQYNWERIHNPQNRNFVESVPTFFQSSIRWTPWTAIISGFCVFFFLGTGKEAMRSYRMWLEAMHLGWIPDGISTVKDKLIRVVPVELLSSISSKFSPRSKQSKEFVSNNTITSTTITSLSIPIMLDTSTLTLPRSILKEETSHLKGLESEQSPSRPRSALRRTCHWMGIRPLSFQQIRTNSHATDQRPRQGSETPLVGSQLREEVPASPWSEVSFGLDSADDRV